MLSNNDYSSARDFSFPRSSSGLAANPSNIISMSLKYVFPKNAFERGTILNINTCSTGAGTRGGNCFTRSDDDDDDGGVSFCFPSAPDDPFMGSEPNLLPNMMTVDELLESIKEVPEELEALTTVTGQDFLSSIHNPFSSLTGTENYFYEGEGCCPDMTIPLPPLFAPSLQLLPN